MGLTTFAEVSRRLIQCGRAPSTPAAAIRWGTRGDQITVEGTLENLPDKIRRARLKPPALIVVGEVVSLRRELNWFEKLPLVGSRVVVTRARGQAEHLSGALRLLGATVIELPTIEICPPNDWAPLDQAIAELEQYDWIIFTSANGVTPLRGTAGRQQPRPAGPESQNLRYRTRHGGASRGLAPQGRSDAIGVRGRKRAGGFRGARFGGQANPAASCCRCARPYSR